MPENHFFASAQSSTLAIPVECVEADQFENWLETQSPAHQSQLSAFGFRGAMGQSQLLLNDQLGPAKAVVGMGGTKDERRNVFRFARGFSSLPKNTYQFIVNSKIENQANQRANITREIMGAALESYRFSRYKSSDAPSTLICPDVCDDGLLKNIADADVLARDLINIPANDLGPEELAQAAQDLALRHDADCHITIGDDLLKANFPLIHTVGRAASRAPRLIEINWGSKGPLLTLVGKGVCFDTGGLNLKPGGSMGLMKKDMGGAASTLGLAALIMAQKLPLRLRVLIPAVENAVSGSAFRPGDVLTARDGTTIEINNTDAEGRLVLADALAYAAEKPSDLTISFATLTGAARVAVGSQIAPFFCDDDQASAAIHQGGQIWGDPVWRLPFWDGYEAIIEPKIADLDNAPSGGMAGSITAALFLRRFAQKEPQNPNIYVHFDIHNWSLAAQPGRPVGAVAQAMRAVYGALGTILKI